LAVIAGFFVGCLGSLQTSLDAGSDSGPQDASGSAVDADTGSPVNPNGGAPDANYDGVDGGYDAGPTTRCTITLAAGMPSDAGVNVVPIPFGQVPAFGGMDLQGACHVVLNGLGYVDPPTLTFDSVTPSVEGAVYFWSGSAWQLRIAGLDAGISNAAHAYEDGIYGYFQVPDPPQCGSSINCTGIPSCDGSPVLTSFIAPVLPTSFATIGGFTSTENDYLTFNVPGMGTVPAWVPASGWVTSGMCTSSGWQVQLTPCREISARWWWIQLDGPGRSQPDAGCDGEARFIDAQPYLDAGAQVGSYPVNQFQSVGVLLQVTDERVTNVFANPARAYPLDLHTVCPFEANSVEPQSYCSRELASTLAPFAVTGVPTDATPARLCGDYPNDRVGTALGQWYPPADGLSIADAEPVPPLWLGRDFGEQQQGIIALGSRDSSGATALPNLLGRLFFSFPIADSAASSQMNVDFGSVSYGPHDGPGPVYCYDELSDIYADSGGLRVILIQMRSPTTLYAEAVFDAFSCSDVAADGGSAFAFQNPDAGVLLER
jgi:hypothetical protein